MLVSGILLVRLASCTFTSCSYPLRIAACATFQCLLGIWILSAGSNLSTDDVLGTEFADLMCDRRDDVATKLFCFAEILSLQAELVLLRHVASSHSPDLIHDVEENGLWCTIALGSMLCLVANISSSDVHGAIG